MMFFTYCRFVFAGTVGMMLFACNKKESDFSAQGGLLPSRYIYINDSSFTPAVLSLAMGNAITFVNSTAAAHSIVSDDSSTIITGSIAPNTSVYFKKDTAGTFFYHCVEHPTARGTVIFTP